MGENDMAYAPEKSLKADDQIVLQSGFLKQGKVGDCIQDELMKCSDQCSDQPLTGDVHSPAETPSPTLGPVPYFSERASRGGRSRPMPPPIRSEKLCINSQWHR